ncbi:hypothetical protein [Halorubrum ezzemoulense]|uniref:Uncharacterized protein n=1 Tax=Halorubrum ezzemoulense TaxID=337243 RepID=A0A256IUI4_HALEZ|nr:hypothetical protein [Halorubrum ezzemoulense]OYR59936.1 hypothetical protein DJ80_16525 [Halorubrum ezzemoulense]
MTTEMSLGTLEQTLRKFPGRCGEWAYHVVLGLIGTITIGVSTANGMTATRVGTVATVLLAATTAVAFTAAYLTATQMDKGGNR